MVKWVLFLFLLTGCKTYTRLSETEIFPDSEPYKLSFYQDCIKYSGRNCQATFKYEVKIVKDLSVGWDGIVGGYCEFLTDTIWINYEAWISSTETERLLTMYHELGHCVLYRFFHTDGLKFKGRYPISIMIGHSGPMPSETIFLENKEYYLNELFN
jgi:hypothetical protein